MVKNNFTRENISNYYKNVLVVQFKKMFIINNITITQLI